jgi:hypothetical protein
MHERRSHRQRFESDESSQFQRFAQTFTRVAIINQPQMFGARSEHQMGNVSHEPSPSSLIRRLDTSMPDRNLGKLGKDMVGLRNRVCQEVVQTI